MLLQNCLFCRVRAGVQAERIKQSAQGNNLEVVALDGSNCLLRFKGSVDKTKLPSFISRLTNSFLFSSVIFAGNVFVGKA